MADTLPPAPIDEPPKSYQWVDWYIKLRKLVNDTTSVAWSSINFVGSNLTSIVTRNHNDLQNINGGAAADYQHLTSAEKGYIGMLLTVTAAANPTTSDIPAGQCKLWLNTTSGQLRLWANDSGTMKSVQLT